MSRDLDRRQFLTHTVAGLGVASVASSCSTATRSGEADAAGTPRPPDFSISLAQWSLHRHLAGLVQPKLDPLDFAATARRHGFGAIEYVNTFYKGKIEDPAFRSELKKRADGEGVRSLLIMCDGEGALGDPDEGQRLAAVANHHKWVEAAAFLGCHSIRVNAQSAGSPDEQRDRAADGLRRLTEFGAQHRLNVIVENHGGLSSNGKWLASVMAKVDHPRCGTLPDFGNFRISQDEEYDRYQGVAEMMPFARAVSAKSYDFDANGDETTIDYRRMLKIVLAAGYHGHLGVEYEGNRLGEEEGLLATKRLLETIRTELAGA